MKNYLLSGANSFFRRLSLFNGCMMCKKANRKWKKNNNNNKKKGLPQKWNISNISFPRKQARGWTNDLNDAHSEKKTLMQYANSEDPDVCASVQSNLGIIKKTCLHNFDLLKPHFYILKPEFTGVYIIFLISAQNIDCGYSLGPPRRGGSNEYPQSIFWAEIWKISEFYICKFSFFGYNFSTYLNRHVFVMPRLSTYTTLSIIASVSGQRRPW